MPEPRRSTIDAGEVERFSALAAEWWNPNGKFRPLHKFNPVRLSYIRDQIATRFGRDPRAARPFEGLRILDIGCGGGLLCEPMARLGAEVVGADASETNIEVAKLHAAEGNVIVDYRATTAEDLADAGETFDVILNMRVADENLRKGRAAVRARDHLLAQFRRKRSVMPAAAGTDRRKQDARRPAEGRSGEVPDPDGLDLWRRIGHVVGSPHRVYQVYQGVDKQGSTRCSLLWIPLCGWRTSGAR